MPVCWHSSATLRILILFYHLPFLCVCFCRIYNKLPEVTKKKEEEKKRAISQTNRLRVEVFKKVDLELIFGAEISSEHWFRETQIILQQKKLKSPNIKLNTLHLSVLWRHLVLFNTTPGSPFKIVILFVRNVIGEDIVYGGVDVSHCGPITLICHPEGEQWLGKRFYY